MVIIAHASRGLSNTGRASDQGVSGETVFQAKRLRSRHGSTHLFTLKGGVGKDKDSSRDSSKLHRGIKVNLNTTQKRDREKEQDFQRPVCVDNTT